jgi:hypothetical protein
MTIPASKKGRIFLCARAESAGRCDALKCRILEGEYAARTSTRDPRKRAKTLFGNEAGAEEGVARLETLRLKVLAIPTICGLGGRRPMSRLGVQDRGLRAKIRCGLHRISTFDLRLLN